METRLIIQVEKHGNQYGWYRAVCPECGCEFVFGCNDLQEGFRCGYVEKIVHCPECMEEIGDWKVGLREESIDDKIT